jgi:hypothetical protein
VSLEPPGVISHAASFAQLANENGYIHLSLELAADIPPFRGETLVKVVPFVLAAVLAVAAIVLTMAMANSTASQHTVTVAASTGPFEVAVMVTTLDASRSSVSTTISDVC